MNLTRFSFRYMLNYFHPLLFSFHHQWTYFWLNQPFDEEKSQNFTQIFVQFVTNLQFIILPSLRIYCSLTSDGILLLMLDSLKIWDSCPIIQNYTYDMEILRVSWRTFHNEIMFNKTIIKRFRYCLMCCVNTFQPHFI